MHEALRGLICVLASSAFTRLCSASHWRLVAGAG